MSPQPILRDRSFLLNPSKCFQTSYNFQCPKTQCCYGFRQDCPFCPHFRNSMLFSHSLPPRSTTWHWGPFFFTVLAAVGTSKPQNQAATKTVEIKPSFSFISLWCHTCVCVTLYTLYRRHPFYYSNSDHHLSKTCCCKCHFPLHPPPAPMETTLVPLLDAGERCARTCICLRATLWYSPAING